MRQFFINLDKYHLNNRQFNLKILLGKSDLHSVSFSRRQDSTSVSVSAWREQFSYSHAKAETATLLTNLHSFEGVESLVG